MAEQQVAGFDFDDWAGLYIENPQEFEARRQTAIMLELLRGSEENASRSRALLEAYEQQVNGCDPQQRMQVAARMMFDSAQQMRTELEVLRHSLEQAGMLQDGCNMPDS